MTARTDHLRALSEEYHAEGRHIEAGWTNLCIYAVHPNAGRNQVEDMRAMYFAGALYMYSSIIDRIAGKEIPSADDMNFLKLIHEEIAEFAQDIDAEHSVAGHA